jgi:hypothetical protein
VFTQIVITPAGYTLVAATDLGWFTFTKKGLRDMQHAADNGKLEALASIPCIDVFLWLQYSGLDYCGIYMMEDTRRYSECNVFCQVNKEVR